MTLWGSECNQWCRGVPAWNWGSGISVRFPLDLRFIDSCLSLPSADGMERVRSWPFFFSRVTKTEDPPSAMYITKRFSFLTYSLSSLNGSQTILTFSTYHLAFTLPTQINAIFRPIFFKTDSWIFIRRWKIVLHCSCGIFPWTMASPLVAFDNRPSYLSHSHPVFRSVDVICDQGKRPWISLIATWCAQR